MGLLRWWERGFIMKKAISNRILRLRRKVAAIDASVIPH
jgi:hypothetical protein